jgi:hypothetical protein
MQNMDYFGNPGLIVESPGTLETDYYGLDTATCVWKCPMDSFGLMPAMLSAHPIWTWLYMEKRRVEITPGFLVITGQYAGITGGRTPSVFECSFAGCEEPIETHPKFISDIAGTPSNPLHGAVFLDPETSKISTDDNKGVFDKFRINVDGARNEFAGIAAYLSPEATVREIWMGTSMVSGVGLGHIGGPPVGVAIEGNWLFTGVSSQQRGKVFANSMEWRASGRNGWNDTIYS